MASFNDIFNPTFFVCLGIIVLVCAALILYFESKMREQNHKFTSMLSLISSMAEELNYIKALTISHTQNGGDFTQPNVVSSQQREFPSNNLIQVSDGEETDNDESSESSSEESMNDSDSDSDSDSSDSELSKSSGNHKNIKYLNIIPQTDNIVITENKDNIIVMDGLEEIEDDDDNDSISCDDLDKDEKSDESSDDDSDNNSENDKLIDFIPRLNLTDIDKKDENLVDSEVQDLDFKIMIDTNMVNESKSNDILDLKNSGDLKKIDILHLDEIDGFLDYKKCSVSKLKSIVVEKGLVSDASKLKKGELLKLLGVSE